MKKVTALTTATLGYLALSSSVFAQATSIGLNRPTLSGQPVGYANLGQFINNVITLAFIIAVIVVLGFLIWGSIEWISSGGDKEAVGKARGKIINALIGLAILAVAFAVFTVAGQFLGLNVANLVVPTPT